MTERQQLVHKAIRESSKSPHIAQLYECAVRAAVEEAVSGRIFLAAHAVRELMNELPAIFDLPKLTSLPQLSNRVRELDRHWAAAVQSACRADGRWRGEIDDPLRGLLQTLEEFFSWRKEQEGMKARSAAELLRKSDPAALSLPDSLYAQRASDFLKLLRYFNAVAHLSDTSLEKFQVRLGALEQILLDSLYRQPSADLSAIDAILAEETTDA